MFKIVVSAVNIFGVLFLSHTSRSLASEDNNFAAVYNSYRENARSGSTDSMENDVDISKGIYRGEASRIYNPERDDRSPQTESTRDDAGIGDKTISEASYNNSEKLNQPSETTQSAVAEEGDWNETVALENFSCEENTENLLAANDDIRIEQSAIDRQYMEHASIENACDRNGDFLNCIFDFESYPNNLQTACNNHMGDFCETEHSIQCHNPNTMESLYYQIDHYPSCFSAACERDDVTRLVSERIDSITRSISEYLEMPCFADDDILRYANQASLIESSGGNLLWHWIWIFPVVPSMLMCLK